MLLELVQMDERETHFREMFLFGVLQARGVCKAERPSQSWTQSTTHIQETHKTTTQYYQEHTRQTTNNYRNHTRYFRYQRCLTTRDVWGWSYHPRVMVGHSCWCIHSPWLSLTWVCPLGTRGLVYRVRPIMEEDWNKDSKMTWSRRRKTLIRIQLGHL
jgi:hypothetical protein